MNKLKKLGNGQNYSIVPKTKTEGIVFCGFNAPMGAMCGHIMLSQILYNAVTMGELRLRKKGEKVVEEIAIYISDKISEMYKEKYDHILAEHGYASWQKIWLRSDSLNKFIQKAIELEVYCEPQDKKLIYGGQRNHLAYVKSPNCKGAFYNVDTHKIVKAFEQ